MGRTPALLAIVAIAVAGLAVAPAAVAADGDFGVQFEGTDDGSATVSVSHDGSAADGAAVTVATTGDNASYAGTGEYAADENGSVALPAPEEPVEVSVSASLDNHSDSTTVTLEAADAGNETDGNASDGAFGQLVSDFVHQAQRTQDGGIGGAVSSFVLEHNPAADRIPDHAGPPAHVFGDDGNASERGPPAHAGPDGNESDGGPPAHAGPGGDDDGNGGGPPEHAGQGDDADEEDDAEDEEEDTEDEETDDADA